MIKWPSDITKYPETFCLFILPFLVIEYPQAGKKLSTELSETITKLEMSREKKKTVSPLVSVTEVKTSFPEFSIRFLVSHCLN